MSPSSIFASLQQRGLIALTDTVTHRGGSPVDLNFDRRCSALFFAYKSTTTSAARRLQAASSSTAPPPQRQRAQARLCRARLLARHAALAWRWRPQLARRTTRARRRREASRRRSVLLFSYGPITVTAAWRARPASSSAASPARDSERLRACAAQDTRAGLALEAPTGTSHHESAPKETGLSPAQCPVFLVWADHNQRGTARTHSNPECCVTSPRQRAHARLRRERHATLAWLWGPQLARRTTGARQRREASRRRSALPFSYEPITICAARRGARAQQARVLRYQPETASAGAPAPRHERRLLGVGGCSWHVEPRARAKEEKLSQAQCPSFLIWSDHNRRGTARAYSNLECCASPQRQRAPKRLRRARHVALACRWRPQLARRITGARQRREASRRRSALLSSYDLVTTSAARCARTVSPSAASQPRESERRRHCAAQDTRAGLALEAVAGTSHHRSAPKETGLTPA